MSTVAERVESIVSDIKVQREELSGKLNLDQPGLNDKWSEIEAKWQEVEAKQTRFSHSVGKSTIALSKDLEQLSAEIKESYAKITLD